MARAVLLLLLAAATTAAGCSGDSGDGGGGGPDAGDPGADASASCLAPPAIGALGALDGAEAVRSNQSGSMGARKVWRVGAFVDESGDQILVELWDEFGAFDGGTVTTGTFEIAGAETAVDSCGVCVYLYGDVAGGLPQQSYLAQSGTVVIEQLLPEMVGSVGGLTFQELDGEDNLVEGGCTSSLESASFTAPVECYDGGGGGGGGGGSGGGGGTGECTE
ncbi:MAG TPA: hypothetical protein VFU21_16490 [Kofleriaceae bacterium]|nr:hypothetical protein [Kofleriaceae bacterium]